MKSPISIQIIRGHEVAEVAWRDISNLRRDVWAGVQRLPPTSVHVDPVDKEAWHFLARADSVLVGAARVSLHDALADVPESRRYPSLDGVGTIASMNRMVVHPNWRRRGLAHALDLARLELIDHSEAEVAIAHTWSPRDQALIELGFIRWASVPVEVDRAYGFEPRPGSVVLNRRCPRKPDTLQQTQKS